MDVTKLNAENLPSVCKRARQHYEDKEYGKSCSFYLLIFHYDKTYSVLLRQEFLAAFEKWVQKLIVLKKLDETQSFINTTLELYSPCDDIVLVASKQLYKCGFPYMALKNITSYFQFTENYDLVESAERLRNLLVDRWHYRMLNDKRRNVAYYNSLYKSFKDGHRVVLDIGSGTGIFSLMAKTLGFEAIYSCEESNVMCDIQRECLGANEASKKVHLINKLSTEVQRENNFERKPTLVVTEIFDCSLLGEGVLPTLIHAWENILDRKTGRVIPHDAIVYGVCVECNELRKHARYEANTDNGRSYVFHGVKDKWDDKAQPYTTENMSFVKGGYRELSEHFLVKSFDFNNLEELKQVIDNCDRFSVPITSSGRFDAVTIYFVLNVDDCNSLSTLDGDIPCWDQAIYINSTHCGNVEANDIVLLDVTCRKEYLEMKVISQREDFGTLSPTDEFKEYLQKEQIEYNIDRRLVAKLNDNVYSEMYQTSLLHQVRVFQQQGSKAITICFLCCELSLLPLSVCEIAGVVCYIIRPSDVQQQLLHHWISKGNIKCVTKESLHEMMEGDAVFDIIVCEPVYSDGLLKDGIIEDLSTLTNCCASEESVFLPSGIDLYSCCFASNKLVCENRVVQDNIPLELRIGEFINEYRVTIHPDVDGMTLLENKLSENSLIMSIDFRWQFRDELCQTTDSITETTISRCGNLAGVMFWFEMKFLNDSLSSEPSLSTHWHQACSLLPEEKHVKFGYQMNIKTARNGSNFHFTIE